MEGRIARIEGILEQMNTRLNHLEADISELRTEIKTLAEKIDRNFRWTLAILLGVLIPMWVTIILAIIFA